MSRRNWRIRGPEGYFWGRKTITGSCGKLSFIEVGDTCSRSDYLCQLKVIVIGKPDPVDVVDVVVAVEPVVDVVREVDDGEIVRSIVAYRPVVACGVWFTPSIRGNELANIRVEDN